MSSSGSAPPDGQPALPVLAFTQGDPAGVGPEILVKLLTGAGGGADGPGSPSPPGADPSGGDRPGGSSSNAPARRDASGTVPPGVLVAPGALRRRQDSAGAGLPPAAPVASAPGPTPAAEPRALYLPLLLAERSALDALRPVLPDAPWHRLAFLDAPPTRSELLELAEQGRFAVYDPVAEVRTLRPGDSGPADAAGALAALDAGIGMAASGMADALVTAPVSKESIARHHLPGFVGHTDYLAAACGLERYGRDYLMAFLAPDLQVALLSTHLPLRRALDAITPEALAEALDCLQRHAGGRIAVAGINPHAGEGGLLGDEDDSLVAPAVAAARERGIDTRGPESADSLFARARRGEFDWVLALYHDQGLIAVKTAAFGLATNWTLGLPWLRTSVDHGTAFDLAGRGRADPTPLRQVVATTLQLIHRTLPKGR